LRGTVLAAAAFLALVVTEATEAQAREELEKRISQMAPDERAFTRFELWFASLPVARRSSAANAEKSDEEVLRQYRTYLKGGGYSEVAIDSQIAEIQQRGKRLEVERWNRFFTVGKPVFNTRPNAFLVEMVTGRTPGRALEVAMGQGRNALWLAQQGWDVTGFDIADKAIAVANEDAAKLGVRIRTQIAKWIPSVEFGQRACEYWNVTRLR
jgi:methylase of polypeptide subunit release factors